MAPQGWRWETITWAFLAESRLTLCSWSSAQSLQWRGLPACSYSPSSGKLWKVIMHLSYMGHFSQNPSCQAFRLSRHREVSYGHKEKWLYFAFRMLDIWTTGNSHLRSGCFCSFVLVFCCCSFLFWFGLIFFFFFAPEEFQTPRISFSHAKDISKNAQIFHNGLDTCHSKRSHLIVSSHPWGESHFRSQLLPFATGRPHLQVSSSCTNSIRLFSQPGGQSAQGREFSTVHKEAVNLWWCAQCIYTMG